ncbi:MAG TPA: hypothetical protein VHD90_27740 [Phototrophicaceae bacterium]|nr:hypothetical protein [Phototrophicaceae bacterium]
MSNIEVVFNLPEELVERAKSEGLLDDMHLAAWLEAQLERRDRVKQLRADVQKLRSLKPALTPEELDAEIAAARKEQS